MTVVNKPVINLPVTSLETGGRVDMPGSLSYSITNPLPGETLQAYSNVNWIRITEITETEVKFWLQGNGLIESGNIDELIIMMAKEA